MARLALLLTLFIATNASAQVCAGSFDLTTQAEVDAMSVCSSVTGDLTIWGANIANLAGLDALTSVGGFLVISGNTGNVVLTNVDGLGALTSVGGSLRISDNAALTNLDGLGGITSVGSSLSIRDNAALDNFCGLFPLLDADGLVGTYTVTGNATNPSEAEILADGPCPAPPVPSLSPLGMTMLLSLLGLAGYRRLRA